MQEVGALWMKNHVSPKPSSRSSTWARRPFPPQPCPDPGSEKMDYLDGDAKKIAVFLWALKQHKGEQRMHAGVWRKVEWREKPDRVGTPTLSTDQLRALNQPFGRKEEPTDPAVQGGRATLHWTRSRAPSGQMNGR